MELRSGDRGGQDPGASGSWPIKVPGKMYMSVVLQIHIRFVCATKYPPRSEVNGTGTLTVIVKFCCWDTTVSDKTFCDSSPHVYGNSMLIMSSSYDVWIVPRPCVPVVEIHTAIPCEAALICHSGALGCCDPRRSDRASRWQLRIPVFVSYGRSTLTTCVLLT
jgi:hypothetical protein